jgi:Phage integrase, N-terminal SAM-like domain
VTIQPSSQPISPLRRRMLDDMAMRGMREATQRDYIRFVRSFAAFLSRPPDTATPEDIRRFQVHQAESGVQPPTINCSVSALRFFFTVTLDRPDLSRRLVLVRHPRRLPTVVSVEEVGRLLEVAPGQRGEPEFWLAPRSLCYSFESCFHGRCSIPLNRWPYLPLHGGHVAFEQFNSRWPLPHVVGSPNLGVLSASLTAAGSLDRSCLSGLAGPTSFRLNPTASRRDPAPPEQCGRGEVSQVPTTFPSYVMGSQTTAERLHLAWRCTTCCLRRSQTSRPLHH